MTIKRRHILGAAAALPFTAALGPATANQWPSQPIKMQLGYSTGGAADMVARAVLAGAEPQLGRPTVVEYRPGAGGAIAAAFVARQPSDGYTLYLADTGSMSIIPNLRTVAYDPAGDFTHLSYVGSSGLVLLVNPQLPVNDVPGLVKLLKEKPEEYAYSSSGVGSPHQLAGELFKQMTGTGIRHVPYRGAAPAMTDLMAGVVQISFATIAPAMPLIEAGRARAIGVTSATRAEALPTVPTIAEQGVAGYDATPWFSVVAPAGLPSLVTQRLREVFEQSLASSEVKASLKRLGVEQIGSLNPDQLAVLVRSDLAKWGSVIKNAGIKLES